MSSGMHLVGKANRRISVGSALSCRVIPTLLNLKTNVHTRPVGERPLIELEPTDHPWRWNNEMGLQCGGCVKSRNALNMVDPYCITPNKPLDARLDSVFL